MAHTALIVDDEADIRELIAMSLDRMGMDTHTAGNLSEARHLLDNYHFDVCLTDMRLPDGNGTDFVKYVVAKFPELPIAVITAHGNMDAAVSAMKNGAFDFVSKPVDLALLRSLVAQAVKMRKETTVQTQRTEITQTPHLVESINVETESKATLSSLYGRRETDVTNTTLIGAEKLIGRSQPMLDLKQMIAKVAKNNAPVWITGESGTGKELIARLIHLNGPRSEAPFVAINCGAIPSELMESEMFGHRKGSFTGAHSDQDGLFKRAEGGTLFLDEIAELPIQMQVKLLRAIQERSIRPVGSADEITTNVRLLSASHKDLANEVEQGKFRHDLYYRLNVISIKSPKLCDRGEDIAIIARHTLQTIAANENLHTTPTLTPQAEIVLSQYSFPGNVRELENILERAVALSENTQIDAADLHLPTQISSGSSSIHITTELSTTAANDNNELQRIVQALEETRWNRRAAAEQLGMTYRQLRYRIQQFGIDKLRGSGS